MGLKLIEDTMKSVHQAKLVIVTGLSGPDENEIRGILQNAGFRISFFAVAATRVPIPGR